MEKKKTKPTTKNKRSQKVICLQKPRVNILMHVTSNGVRKIWVFCWGPFPFFKKELHAPFHRSPMDVDMTISLRVTFSSNSSMLYITMLHSAEDLPEVFSALVRFLN